MKFQHRNITEKSQWQNYKELELLPNSLPKPEANKQKFAFGLEQAWRLLIVALGRELVYEQQVEYLERCWALNCFEPDTDKNSNTWHQLWLLMN